MDKPNVSQTEFPSLNGRYVVVDTETTGANPVDNNIIEIACVEIENGKITGNEFHAFLHPRYPINQITEKKHKLSANFYDSYFSDVYSSDKKCLETFKSFVGGSFIFAHNASVDMQFINNELNFHGLSIIPKNKFWCTMKIFQSLFPGLSRNCSSLSKCCEYFDLVSPNQNFHSAIHDSFMVARVVCKFFELFNQKEENEKEEQDIKKDKEVGLGIKRERDVNEKHINDNNECKEKEHSDGKDNKVDIVNVNESKHNDNEGNELKNECNNNLHKEESDDAPIVLGSNDINDLFNNL
jgi:DNA polymerase-3 subunit epsilon